MLLSVYKYISGYRFDILHEESIEFQNFNLRNNVCQLCAFKVNLPCISLIVSFFFKGGESVFALGIVFCPVSWCCAQFIGGVTFNLSDLFVWHFQCAYYFDKLLDNVAFGSLYLAKSADQTNRFAAVQNNMSFSGFTLSLRQLHLHLIRHF